MQVGAMLAQCHWGRALQARRCIVQLGQYERETDAHVLLCSVMMRFFVSSLRRWRKCQRGAYAYAGRGVAHADWPGEDGPACACRGASWFAKLSCARTSPISRSHVRATPFPSSVFRFSPTPLFPASRLLFSASIMVSWKLSSLLLLSLGALNAFAAIDVSSPRLDEA